MKEQQVKTDKDGKVVVGKAKEVKEKKSLLAETPIFRK